MPSKPPGCGSNLLALRCLFAEDLRYRIVDGPDFAANVAQLACPAGRDPARLEIRPGTSG
jgi:hypothetical protein